MMKRQWLAIFRTWLVMALGMTCVYGAVAADDTNTAVNAEAKAAEAALIRAQENLRANLQIQEQLRNTQQAIEQYRQESETSASRTAELLSKRLDAMESAMATQRLEAMKELQRSNQVLLIVAGGIAGFGFLALVFAAFAHWRMVHRITALASNLAAGRTAEVGHGPAALGMGGTPLLPAQALERSTAEFSSIVERLEKRIHEMDSAAQAHLAAWEHLSANSESNGATAERPGADVPVAASEDAKRINVLLGKGQTLLKLDKAEAALACFDEALAVDGGNTEALLKRGAALERLQRLDEAIECYDRAIATNSSITMAYLHKGGVYNQLERYTEALQCYEQALKSQEKNQASETVPE